MQKGKKNKDFERWKRCAKLAIAWNKSEIARSIIFNIENRCHWQVGRFIINGLKVIRKACHNIAICEHFVVIIVTTINRNVLILAISTVMDDHC